MPPIPVLPTHTFSIFLLACFCFFKIILTLVIYFLTQYYMTLIDKSRFYGIKKDDPDVNRGRLKCFHNGIILIVNCFLNYKYKKLLIYKQ